MFGRITFIAALMILTGMVFASFKSFHTSDFSGPALPVTSAVTRRAPRAVGAYQAATDTGTVGAMPPVQAAPGRKSWAAPQAQVPQMPVPAAPQAADDNSTDNSDNDNSDDNNNNDNNDNDTSNDNNDSSQAEPAQAPIWHSITRPVQDQSYDPPPITNLPGVAFGSPS